MFEFLRLADALAPRSGPAERHTTAVCHQVHDDGRVDLEWGRGSGVILRRIACLTENMPAAGDVVSVRIRSYEWLVEGTVPGSGGF